MMTDRVFAVDTGRNATDSGLQKWRPPAQPLMTYSKGVSAGSGISTFLVPIPDSRLRVKIDTLFIPAPGTPPPLTGFAGTASILLFEAEDDDIGSGAVIPTNLIEGTIVGTTLTPTVIPTADTLLGYSREFWSAADYIVGTLTTNKISNVGGVWVLQCRYQPDGVRFTPKEWQEITAACSPRATYTPLSL